MARASPRSVRSERRRPAFFLHALLATDIPPYLTDQQNHLLDCDFGLIRDAHELAAKLKTVAGVVEHGLFLDMASAALVADGSQILVLRPQHPPIPLSQSDLAFD